MDDMEPALDEMAKALTEMEPAMRELIGMIDDIRNYDAPEMLENGDIIIRRKAPKDDVPSSPDAGEIDL